MSAWRSLWSNCPCHQRPPRPPSAHSQEAVRLDVERTDWHIDWKADLAAFPSRLVEIHGRQSSHPLPGSPSHILLHTEVVGLGWVGAEGEGSHEATVSKSHGQLPVQPRRPLGCLVSLLGR